MGTDEDRMMARSMSRSFRLRAADLERQRVEAIERAEAVEALAVLGPADLTPRLTVLLADATADASLRVIHRDALRHLLEDAVESPPSPKAGVVECSEHPSCYRVTFRGLNSTNGEWEREAHVSLP